MSDADHGFAQMVIVRISATDEQAFTDLGCVGNDRAHTEGTAAKSMKPVSRLPGIVVDLREPSANYTYSRTALEALDTR